MKQVFFFNILIPAAYAVRPLLLWCKSRLMPLNKKSAKFWLEWSCTFFSTLFLLSAAEVAYTASPKLKSKSPPYIRCDFTTGCCKTCIHEYIAINTHNRRQSVETPNIRMRENLENCTPTLARTAHTPVSHGVSGGILLGVSALLVNGANGSTPTWKPTQLPDLCRLDTAQSKNKFKSINTRDANKTIGSRGSPWLLASNKDFRFTSTGYLPSLRASVHGMKSMLS